MRKLLALGLIIYSLSSFLPVLKSDHWAVRAWDFPRLQLLIIGLMFFLPALVMAVRTRDKNFLWLIIPLIALVLDVYRLYPYSPLSPVESKMTPHREGEFSIMISNVLQDNKEYDKLIDLIEKRRPDFVFLFEVDSGWIKGLEKLPGYPHRHSHPQDNTYGIAFLSQTPVKSVTVNHWVEKDVPSFEVEFEPQGRGKVTIFAVHPKPPKPGNNSDERDAELVIVAKKSKEKESAILVLGDLNDVAWSHTTRLFRRISGLLDPRVGRRPFATFPALSVLFRFPLDYIFHSPELKLTDIEILSEVNSDHLPLMASFYLDGKKDQKNFESPEEEDVEEARKIIKKGKDQD